MTAETTRRNPPVSSGDFEGVRSERENGREVSSLHSPDGALRNTLRSAGAWLKGWIVPPNVLVLPPPAWAQLSAYAYRGDWTRDLRGFIRGLGTLWLTLVALPVVAICRYVEWVFARPTRAIFFIAIWLLVVHSDGPGPWLATYVIRPFWSGLGWIFLP